MENTKTINFSELPTTYDAKATEEKIYKFSHIFTICVYFKLTNFDGQS